MKLATALPKTFAGASLTSGVVNGVVNDEGGELWMYNIVFHIPIKYQPE
jgi:hypothetical protein